LQPAFPVAYLKLDMAPVQLAQLDEAERQFEKTLRLDPKNSKFVDRVAVAQNDRWGRTY
jgi:hypothetical protein